MKDYCHVSRQIADHCHIDEDDRSCSEIFTEMKEQGWAWLGGEQVWLYQITDKMDIEDLREASHSLMLGDDMAIYKLYIETIKEF